MINTDYIESELRATRDKMNVLFDLTVGNPRCEPSQHERHLLTLRYNALENYYRILDLHLDMLAGED